MVTGLGRCIQKLIDPKTFVLAVYVKSDDIKHLLFS